MRSTAQPVMIDDVEINSFHQLLTLRTGLGWVMVGYILSIIGVATLPMSASLQLSGFWQGMIAAMALLGVFAGGFFGGWLTDRVGRQKLFFVAPAIVMLASVGMLWVQDPLTLSVLRLLCGLAVGIEYTAAGSLLTEFIPQKSRGSRLSLLTVLWFVGAALAYIAGNFMLADAGPEQWRTVMASPAIIAGLLLLVRLGTPESPRWLLSKGRRTEAEQVIRKVYGQGFSLRNISDDSASGQTMSFIGALRAGYGKRILFVVMFWACAVIPLFAVYAFVPKLFQALQLTGNLAALGSMGITLILVLGCIIATWLINYLGRRTIILHSFLWSGLALLGLGLFPDAQGWVVLSLFGAYALFIGGAQVLEFVYPNELFPTEIRAFAVGMGASLAAFEPAIGTWLVPISLEHYGIANTMFAAAAITMMGLAVSLVLAPETKSMSLQEAAAL
ncbi:Inner membrane metabolite transport protein YgcS [Pseudomonas sp. MM221]|nr:Inner membrane metabolite transport protein YgcS [Pseudomonas sp. MM223]CAI3802679.1 Inner membrane metabolite transport protein YgcS [Pseudomonas sp. MM221]